MIDPHVQNENRKVVFPPEKEKVKFDGPTYTKRELKVADPPDKENIKCNLIDVI